MSYYEKHLLLPEIGVEGQHKLLSARVLVIGAGGLAAGVIPPLAGAGVGLIRIVDDDLVELSNLHRQTIHSRQHLGIPKVYSAKEFVQRVNDSIEVEAVPERLTIINAERLVKSIDLILDCSDNLGTRRLISDISVLFQIPVVSGSAIRLQGQLLLYGPGIGSYRSLVGSQYEITNSAETANLGFVERLLLRLEREMQPSSQSCANTGVFGPIPGFIGYLMTIEAVKLLLGLHIHYNFITYDMNDSQAPFRFVTLKNKKCEIPITKFHPEDYLAGCSTSFRNEIEPVRLSNESYEIAWSDFHLDSGSVLVDIRPLELARLDSVSDSLKLPFQKLCGLLFDALKFNDMSEFMNVLGKYTTVYIYCSCGVTSKKAVELLVSFCDVVRRLNEKDDKKGRKISDQFCRMNFFSAIGGFSRWKELRELTPSTLLVRGRAEIPS